MTDQPVTETPAAVASSPSVAEPAAVEAASGWTPETSPMQPPASSADEKPELVVAAAFGAGLACAMILRRLVRS